MSEKMMQLYGYVMEKMKKDSVDRMEQFIAGVSGLYGKIAIREKTRENKHQNGKNRKALQIKAFRLEPVNTIDATLQYAT